jgi:hypothetical protein
MLGFSKKLSRSLAVFLGLALTVPVAQAHDAQVAPAVGSHSGARPSGTGFAGRRLPQDGRIRTAARGSL